MLQKPKKMHVGFLSRLERSYGGTVAMGTDQSYRGVEKQVISFYCRKCGSAFFARANHIDNEAGKHECRNWRKTVWRVC